MDEERKDEREQDYLGGMGVPEGSAGQAGPTGFIMRPASEEQSSQSQSQPQPGRGSGSEPPGASYSSEQSGASFGFEQPRPEASFAEKPKKKMNPAAKKVIAVVLVVILAAGSGFGGAMAAMYYAPGLIPSATNTIHINPNDSLSTGEAIAEKVIPSVVGISIKGQQNVNSMFFGRMTQEFQGVGTGLIVDEKGYILTNSHVVNDGNTQEITVQLADGREVDGTVLWNDASLDLAIVKIDAPNLQAAELGDSDEVKIGAYAAAIGNPMGLDYARSMSQGIISGLNRSITVSSSSSSQGTTMDGLIQTDASINHGNSGGPLLNSEGQVIGINTAKADSGEGMGFAIPINVAKPIVDQIKEKGEFQRSYIGITGISVSDLLEQYPDTKLGAKSGVYVYQIYTESPAAASGLREEDIIVKLNDKEIETMQQLTSALIQYRPGDKVTLDVVRNGQNQKIEVTLAASPK